MTGGGRERRRWPRAPLKGELVGQIYTEHAAPVLDLSQGGALVEVPCVLRPRSIYSVRLLIAPGIVLTLKASVMRSYVHHLETAGGGETRVRYQAALQFMDVRPSDQELLRRRIAEAVPVVSAGLLETGHTESAAPAVERRDFARADLDGNLSGGVGLHVDMRVLSLSPGGMTARMPMRPEIGSTLSSVLEIHGGRIQVRSIVRDAYQHEAGARTEFVVGMEFVDLAPGDRRLIEAYLARTSSDPA
jgi:hypothetical protein